MPLFPTLLSGLVQGQILFANSSGQPAGDLTKLFWDDTNLQLGIGTNTPPAACGVALELNKTASGGHADELRITLAGLTAAASNDLLTAIRIDALALARSSTLNTGVVWAGLYIDPTAFTKGNGLANAPVSTAYGIYLVGAPPATVANGWIAIYSPSTGDTYLGGGLGVALASAAPVVGQIIQNGMTGGLSITNGTNWGAVQIGQDTLNHGGTWNISGAGTAGMYCGLLIAKVAASAAVGSNYNLAAARIDANSFTLPGGAGTNPGNGYGLWVSAPTIATTNWAIWVDSGDVRLAQHLISGGSTPTLGALQTGISSQSISGTDLRPAVSLTTTGTPPGAGVPICIVNYATAYPGAPNPVWSWQNATISNPTVGNNAAGTCTLESTAAMGASTTFQAGGIVVG
jgi:hypothetical protein